MCIMVSLSRAGVVRLEGLAKEKEESGRVCVPCCVWNTEKRWSTGAPFLKEGLTDSPEFLLLQRVPRSSCMP